MVGEETNKRISYLAAVSRLLEKPLAIIVQSGSAAGKTSLMEAVLAFLPEEQRVQYSAMTGQALFYHRRNRTKTQNAGRRGRGRRAARGLCAETVADREGVLTIASTGKESKTGRADYARVPRRRPGDDLPHHNRRGDGRGIAESLHRAYGERRPGTDESDPPEAARSADARGPMGARRAPGHPQTASQRAAPLASDPHGQRARAQI